MTYRDMLLTCRECGKKFFFTVDTQRRLEQQGQDATPPELCEACTTRIKYGGKLHGRVKWFNLEKGFGFILQDEGGEIFVHRSGVAAAEEGSMPPLEDGQEVLYEVADTPKGPQAVQVRPYQA